MDALVGRRTRRHADLDLLVDAGHEDAGVAPCCGGRAIARSRGRALIEGALFPERTWLADARGRQIDLHPVAFDVWLTSTAAALLPGRADPAAAAFAQGYLEGEPVPCLSREVQLAAHEGYAHRRVDDRDVALLRDLAPR